MLSLKNVSVSYARARVLDNVTLEVEPGEILALVGPNGAGKSTLIRAVSGVVPLASGEVRVDDVNLRGLSTMDRARRVAVVPQARSLPPAFTVYETVLLGRTPHLGWLGRPTAGDLQLVDAALEQTELRALATRFVGELSGGEQQRVLLARALAQDTPVMLLDEPTTHLDMQHRENLIHTIRSLAETKTLAVVIVLHDLNLVGLFAQRVALLVQGRLEALGVAGEVLTESRLARAFQVAVRVVSHPESGTPLVLPGRRE